MRLTMPCVCQNEQSAPGKVRPDSAAGVFTSVLYGGVCRVGEYLFKHDTKKKWCFQIVVWLLYAVSLIADWSVAFGLYQNCWNGETLFLPGRTPAYGAPCSG